MLALTEHEALETAALSSTAKWYPRVEDLQLIANNDLNIAEADLSFSFPDLVELKGFDYFELRDFNISNDSLSRTLDQWSWEDAECVAKIFTVDNWSSSQGLVVQACDASSTLEYLSETCAIADGSLNCSVQLNTASNDSRETLAIAIRVQNDSGINKERSRLSNRVLFSRVAPPSEPIDFEIIQVTSRNIDIQFESPTDFVLPRGGPATRTTSAGWKHPTRRSQSGMTSSWTKAFSSTQPLLLIQSFRRRLA